MVQFVNLPVSRKELLKEQLGMSLGKGLADFANNYFANKSMEEVINDPSLKEAPVSERLSRLQSALTPYGETGMQVLQNRLGIEQQRAQEQQKSQQEALIKKKAPVFAKALRKEPLTEEETNLLSPEEQLSIAKHHQAIELQNLKNKEDVQLEKDTAQNAFNEMADILNRGRIGLTSGVIGAIPFFGTKTAEDAAQFQSLGGALESILVKMVNKGTLSNTRFKYIVDTLLPKPNDREATIRGKLKGIAQILNIDASALGEETKESVKSERPGFVKLKDPQGVERWIPEHLAQQFQGSNER